LKGDILAVYYYVYTVCVAI